MVETVENSINLKKRRIEDLKRGLKVNVEYGDDFSFSAKSDKRGRLPK